MRTIETKIYKFDELSETAKTKALDKVKEYYMDDSSFVHDYITDNCYLFEPSQEELTKVFGKNFNELLFTNNRKNIYYDLYEGWVTFEEAIGVPNNENFYKWLGLSKRTQKKIENFWFENERRYKTTLNLEFNAELTEKQKTEVAIAKDKWLKHTTTLNLEFNADLTKKEEKELEEAVEKWNNHCEVILKGMKASYDYLNSDEYAMEEIERQVLEFTEKGEIYND